MAYRNRYYRHSSVRRSAPGLVEVQRNDLAPPANLNARAGIAVEPQPLYPPPRDACRAVGRHTKLLAELLDQGAVQFSSLPFKTFATALDERNPPPESLLGAWR